MKETRLGEFEEVILLLVGILGEEAYAYKIAEEFESQTGRAVSIGATHSTLSRLEDKGFLTSEMGQATPQRGGRRKRIYTITAYGRRALKVSKDFKVSLWKQYPAFAPDLSMGIGIGFSNKGKVSFPYISSNLLFDFDSEDNMNVNTFINLGYGWDINKQLEERELLGLELGYLVHRQGTLFGKNTFKFGANWSPVKGVYVNPHLYLTDNFHRLFPGIRIGFGF